MSLCVLGTLPWIPFYPNLIVGQRALTLSEATEVVPG